MSVLRLTLLTLLVACWCSGGQAGEMLSVADPRSNLWLLCPEGEEITIQSMAFNVMGFEMGFQGFCTSERNCLHPLFKPWSKAVCDNLQQCRLPKPDPRMSLCSAAIPFYLSALYTCQNNFPGKRTVIACDGEKADLKCEKGVIRIIKANYGRLDQNTCTSQPSIMTFCISDPGVNESCDGKASCSVVADPKKSPASPYCDSSPKYVYVSYYCEE